MIGVSGFNTSPTVHQQQSEPTATHTQNYRYRMWRRALRFAISFCCSGVLLLASYFSLQYFSGKKGSVFSAILISCINILLVRGAAPFPNNLARIRRRRG